MERKIINYTENYILKTIKLVQNRRSRGIDKKNFTRNFIVFENLRQKLIQFIEPSNNLPSREILPLKGLYQILGNLYS